MSPHASFPVAFVQRADVLEGLIYRDGVGYARNGLVRGEGEWRDRSLWFVCPCGCETIQAVTVEGSGWQWNGDADKPTLSPSIALINGCDWHGFLKDGQWTL